MSKMVSLQKLLMHDTTLRIQVRSKSLCHKAIVVINDISLAMMAGIGLRRLADVSHPYPTQAAAIKIAADTYRGMRSSGFRRWWLRKWLAW